MPSARTATRASPLASTRRARWPPKAAHLGLKCVLVQENWVKYSDAVCEGKSMHRMIDRVRRGEFPEGSRVLYAYLGGVPTLNAYSFLFCNG